MRRIAAVVIIVGLAALSAFSQDRIRELFEWGEYDSLVVALGRYVAASPGAADSVRLCRYYSYGGVAYFAKGDIAEARRQFETALKCNLALTLDPHYVTPEMLNLFSATKNELEQQLLYSRMQDSLSSAREAEQAATEKLQLQTAVRRSSFRKNGIGATVGFSLSAAMGGLAGYEFASGKAYNQRFTDAAAIGDKATYDHYRTLLKRQNGYVMGYAAASAASGCIGAYCTFRCIMLSRTKLSLETSGAGQTFRITGEF